MKKIIMSIVVIAFCFVVVLCSCSTTTEKTDDTNNNSQSENIQQATDSNSSSQTSEQINDLVSSFQPPAEVFEIDLSKVDPSNDDIRFEYDEQGRISKCYYKVNDIDVYQSYIYENNSVQIFSFNDSVVIGDVFFENVVYDEKVGFSECDGYYFKNVVVK